LKVKVKFFVVVLQIVLLIFFQNTNVRLAPGSPFCLIRITNCEMYDQSFHFRMKNGHCVRVKERDIGCERVRVRVSVSVSVCVCVCVCVCERERERERERAPEYKHERVNF
jgi:hypothetical protein